MREAGAPSTGEVVACLPGCACPPGVVMVSSSEVPRNAERAQGEGPRPEGVLKSAAKGIIVAGVLHLASLQRGSLILREDCYTVVTRAPTVGNDLVVPDSKREGRHARYALLGTRSAGGGRRPGDRLGAVPIGPPLALAARCGPGLTLRRLPRPVNGERWVGLSGSSGMGSRPSAPTDLRPSPALPPYHKKCQMFLSTTKGRNPDKDPGLVGAKVRPGRRGGGPSQTMDYLI
jgi:hypothetical protein